MAGLHFEFTGNNSQLINSLNQSRAAFNALQSASQQTGMSMDGVMNSVQNMAGALAGFAGLSFGGSAFIKQVIDVRSQFQDAESSMKVFLGSADEAKTFINDLEKAAFNNVFDFTALTEASTQLLAFKTDVNDVIPTIEKLSNIASGTGGSLGELVQIYNKVKSTDKMEAETIMQLGTRGIDIRGMIAQIRTEQGTQTSVKDLEGVTFGFRELEDVINRLTSEGGDFYGMMDSKMNNLSSASSRLNDAIASMFNGIGKETEGILKEGIDAATALVNNYKEVAKIIGEIAVAYGSWKAAHSLIIGVQKASKQLDVASQVMQLQNLADATKNVYNEEVGALQNLVAIQDDSKNADIEMAVAKGQLTQAQAAEIINLRELAQERVGLLQQASEQAAMEAQMANDAFLNAQQELANAQAAKLASDNEVDAAMQALEAAQAAGDAKEIEAAQTALATAATKQETATKAVNTATTNAQAAADRKEAAASTAEAASANADAAAQQLDAIAKGQNTTATTFLGRAQQKLNTLLKATNMTMLASPYFWAAAAVAALCVGIYKLCTAETAAEKATRKHNEALAERSELQQNESGAINEKIDTIQNNDSSQEGRARALKAYNELRSGKLVHNGEELPSEVATQLVEMYQVTGEDGEVDLTQSFLKFAAANKQELDKAITNLQAKVAHEQNVAKLNELKESVGVLENNLLNVGATMSGQGGAAAVSMASNQIKQQIDEAKTNIELLEAEVQLYNDVMNKAADVKAVEDKGLTLAEIQKQILAQEKVVEEARRAYAANGNQENLTALNNAESIMTTLTNKYKNMTDKQWVMTKQMNEKIKEDIEKAVQEEINIRNSALKDIQAKREADLQSQLKNIDLEEDAFKRANNGRTSSAFNKQRANVKLKVELETKEAEREFKTWVADMERNTIKIQTEIDTANLQRQVDMAVTRADKDKATQELRNQQLGQMDIRSNGAIDLSKMTQMEDDMRKDMSSKFDMSIVDAYLKGEDKYIDALGEEHSISAETISQLDTMRQSYIALANAKKLAMTNDFANEDLKTQIDDLSQYQQEMSEVEEWRQAEYKKIAAGQSTSTRAEIDAVTKQKKAQLAIKFDIDGIEDSLSTIVTNLTTNLSNGVYQSIVTMGQDALDVLAQKSEYLDKIKGMSAEEKASEVSTLQQQLSEQQAQSQDANLTAEQKAEIDAKIAELQERINYLLMSNNDLEKTGLQIANTKVNVQEKINKAQEQGVNSANKLTSAEKWNIAADGMNLAKEALDAFADSMGTGLTKEGKKAINVLTSIVDFAISNVNNIQEVVSIAAKASKSTADSASEALSEVEQASLVLTIISMAISLIQKIAEICQQFTKSAMLQEAIDAHLDKVDELKRKHEQLERKFKNDVGVSYYKNMLKWAKDYSETIEEQRKALEDAERLYQLQANRYGQDSDKAKEAQEQVNEIQDSLNESIDDEAQAFKDIANELVGTDLKSFSESLADELVEGFSTGIEGIEDSWDNMLKDIMTNMVKQRIALRLQDQLEGVFAKIDNFATNDGEITEEEMQTAMAMLNSAGEGVKSVAESYYRLMDEMGLLTDEDSDESGTSAGIKKITQDQADELTARLTAIQITTANQEFSLSQLVTNFIEDSRLKLGHLAAIEVNTGFLLDRADTQIDLLTSIEGYARNLTSMKARLDDIERNTHNL